MSSIKSFDRPRFLVALVVMVLVFLFLPVVVVGAYSFNDGRSLYQFSGISLRWYQELFTNRDIMDSLLFSLRTALIVTVLSVLLGTLLAFGIHRGLRKIGLASHAIVLLRVITPETATAVSLLILFTQVGIRLSEITLVLSHTVMCLAFVTVIVLSRLVNLNQEIEDSAMDLGATKLGSIWFVAIPSLKPAIAAGGLLSFVLSFDNFITSFFTSGIGATPLPVRIYSMIKMGVTPVINAAGMFMLAITIFSIILILLIGYMWRKRPSDLYLPKERANEY